MTAIRHHRKDLMVEARFLPDSIEQAEELRALIRHAINEGWVDDLNPRYAESTANAMIGWLIGKREGVDTLAATTRSQYRKVLTALEVQAGGGPGGDRGTATHGVAAVLAALGAAGALAPVSPAGALLALALAPIIYEAPVEGELPANVVPIRPLAGALEARVA